MKAICVYCGANPGARPEYAEQARALGRVLAGQGLGLVYGGGNVGLMGIIADEVLRCGGEAVGIIPEALMKKEIGHMGLTELHIVSSMHERKQMMADRSDAFIAMPGGVGTYEELFETFTWLQLGYHSKPIGLLNVNGFYDGLLGFLQHAADEGFLRANHAAMLQVSTDPADLVEQLTQWTPQRADRWDEARDKI